MVDLILSRKSSLMILLYSTLRDKSGLNVSCTLKDTELMIGISIMIIFTNQLLATDKCIP